MKRNQAILIVVFALFLVFPTPHSRTRHETKYATGAIDCVLPVGEKVGVHWVLQGWHELVIVLESTEEIRITFRDADGGLYNLTKKVHRYDYHGYSDATYDIFIMNPIRAGNGSTATVSGSMSADEIVRYQEWLPWWIP